LKIGLQEEAHWKDVFQPTFLMCELKTPIKPLPTLDPPGVRVIQKKETSNTTGNNVRNRKA